MRRADDGKCDGALPADDVGRDGALFEQSNNVGDGVIVKSIAEGGELFWSWLLCVAFLQAYAVYNLNQIIKQMILIFSENEIKINGWMT